MGFSIVKITEEERIKGDEWSEENILGAEVLKEFTTQQGSNKFERILIGTISNRYQFCNMHFISENGVDCLVNICDVYNNEDFFKKIVKNENKI